MRDPIAFEHKQDVPAFQICFGVRPLKLQGPFQALVHVQFLVTSILITLGQLPLDLLFLLMAPSSAMGYMRFADMDNNAFTS